MVATINRLLPIGKFGHTHIETLLVSVGLGAMVLLLAQHAGWWPFALIVVAGVELWRWSRQAPRRDRSVRAMLLELSAFILIGWSTVLIIALMPRFVTQVGVATLYVAWRLWWIWSKQKAAPVNLLIMQIAIFEAIFLMAAIWQTPEWLVLALAWAAAWASVFTTLARRAEPRALVVAFGWALIVAEVSWVLQLWLFTYATPGGYILVPQPVLVLVALAYCFGSIYISAKHGSLSRPRLVEYLVIGLILIGMVITGTSWRGSL